MRLYEFESKRLLGAADIPVPPWEVHIEPCHEVFTPSAEEIAQAQRVIKAFEKAERQGKAAIQLDGKFFDYAVVKRSKRICKLAKIISTQSLQCNR
ncbi:hypothetical protein ES703_42730 [subsurface metagenome]